MILPTPCHDLTWVIRCNLTQKYLRLFSKFLYLLKLIDLLVRKMRCYKNITPILWNLAHMAWMPLHNWIITNS